MSLIYDNDGRYKDEWMEFSGPLDVRLMGVVTDMIGYLEKNNAPTLDYKLIELYIKDEISLKIESAWLDHVEKDVFGASDR